MLIVIQKGPAIERRYRCRMSCQPSVIQSSDFLRPSERSRIAATIRLSEKDFIAVPATRSRCHFGKEVELPGAWAPASERRNDTSTAPKGGGTIAAVKGQCNNAVPVDRHRSGRVTSTIRRRASERT